MRRLVSGRRMMLFASFGHNSRVASGFTQIRKKRLSPTFSPQRLQRRLSLAERLWQFRTSSVTAAGTRRSEPAIREVCGPPGPFLIPTCVDCSAHKLRTGAPHPAPQWRISQSSPKPSHKRAALAGRRALHRVPFTLKRGCVPPLLLRGAPPPLCTSLLSALRKAMPTMARK